MFIAPTPKILGPLFNLAHPPNLSFWSGPLPSPPQLFWSQIVRSPLKGAATMRNPEEHLNSEENQLLRARIRQLLSINNQTSSDISFEAYQLATNLNTAKVKVMLLVNKVNKIYK